ncbi:MAG: prepilin-type N-terminal cleavage/methylation domain-containing protein [Candidatus Omnitrophica bacterium]|nr:prepilin-type N-terminal cleavage/methylation domain-containing protein [Candidatus Omnitrophota bacterium]
MKNTKAGFSLIEVIIAIILIAIAAIGALSYIVYCNHLTLQVSARIVAANFARETMEGLYKKDYPGLNVTAGDGLSDPLPGATAFGGAFLSRYSTATRKYTITDMGGYKLIIAKVTWDQ